MTWLFSRVLMQGYENSRCSRALVAASSPATCSDGALSAPLSVMPTQHKFWRNDKTMEPSDLSRFGLTCAVLTADRGEAVLMWCLEASLARTSALPARVQALTAPAAGCGTTWRASLAKFDPNSSTWRTAQPSLLGDSDESSVTWPRSGMTAGGLCWELPMLAPPISVIGSGLWVPTPMAADSRGSSGRPAPGKQVQLVDVVRMVATPTARDWRSGKASQATHDKNSRPLSEQIGGSLNPPWVEWLMGWPIGWTDLKPLGTVRCQPAPQPHGECSQAVEA